MGESKQPQIGIAICRRCGREMREVKDWGCYIVAGGYALCENCAPAYVSIVNNRAKEADYYVNHNGK